MSKKIIRRSPSGPIVGSLGPGAMIRMAEGSLSGSQTFNSGAPTIVGDGNATDLTTSFDAPQPDLEYRVEAEFDLSSSSSGSQTVTLELLATYDGGAPEVIETQVLDLAASPGKLHVHTRFTLDDLPNMPAETLEVVFNCRLTTTDVVGCGMNAPGNGRLYMSASEHVPQA
jgi:hypothetical protein